MSGNPSFKSYSLIHTHRAKTAARAAAPNTNAFSAEAMFADPRKGVGETVAVVVDAGLLVVEVVEGLTVEELMVVVVCRADELTGTHTEAQVCAVEAAGVCVVVVLATLHTCCHCVVTVVIGLTDEDDTGIHTAFQVDCAVVARGVSEVVVGADQADHV